MRKTRTTLVALALLGVLASCASQAAAPTPAPTPEPTAEAKVDYQTAYAVEKLNEVNDMVLERKVIPEDYLRYLDGPAAEKAETYNAALTNAKAVAVRYAKEWADTFREMSPEDDAAFASYGRYLEEGDNYFRFIEEFSAALLYPNSYDFTIFGTVVGYPASCESGGSGGLWSMGYYMDQNCIEELTSAVNDLLDQFDAARAELSE